MQEVALESGRYTKGETMKRSYSRLLFALVLSVFFAGTTTAQYDDIYFDPDAADEVYAAVELEKYYDESAGVQSRDIEDDYEYYYSSRIRRFNNPYYGFDFYSPAYVDPVYYNAALAGFYSPGSSIYWGNPVTARNSFAQVSTVGAWGYPAPVGFSTGIGFNSGFGGVANPVGFGGVSTFGGSSFGAPGAVGGFGTAGGFAGGYNAYCPPAVGGIAANPSTGVFRPGNTGTVNTSGPAPRGNTVSGNGTVYGPRGSVGSTNGSPRTNTRGGSVGYEDRPLTSGSTAGNVRGAQQTTYNGARATYSGSSSPRAQRPSYTPPASAANRTYTSTRNNSSSSRSGFSSTRPSRPSANSYRPSSQSSRSTFSRPSSSSSRSSFSSPRSGSSMRSSGSSFRSSGGGAARSGGSPRGGN